MDVNAQDDAGETPLHWAAMTGQAIVHSAEGA